jgi:copper chaperone CopZ
MVASPPGKGRARAGRPREKEDEAMGQIVALQVQGMDCGACERRLETVLGRLDGVGQAEADHVTGRVRLRFDPSRVGASALATAAAERIGQAGFTVAGLPQPEDEGPQ